MSRKDYIAAAEIIRTTPLSDAQRASLAQQFADYFLSDNSQFRRIQFYKACGVMPERESV